MVLQRLLGRRFKVTNLGSSGATLSKEGKDGQGDIDAAYWHRPVFTELTSQKWDAVVIMLGTNDAKLARSGAAVDNWVSDANYTATYADLIQAVRSLGSERAGGEPHIFICAPAPCMLEGAFGLNKEIINTVLPPLVRKIATDAGLPFIDIFHTLGGGEVGQVPETGLTLDYLRAHPSPSNPAQYFCDEHWNDGVHACDHGFETIAKAVAAAILERLGSEDDQSCAVG
jgi:lysophospholipase L1-like esterase